jgi:hypothetical protein
MTMLNTKNQMLPAAVDVTDTNGLPESPNGVESWWKRKNLRALNFWMLIPLLSIFAQGYVFT